MQISEAIKLIDHPVIKSDFPTTWADFGAGSGLFTNALATILHPGSTLIAVDKDISNFEVHAKTTGMKLKTMKADFTQEIQNLPALHGVLMANSLHFVDNKKNLLVAVMKYFVDKPLFLIIEYDTDKANPWVPYPVSFTSLKKLSLDLGLEMIEKVAEVPSRFNRANIYSALLTRQ